jgi:hypothetical protein
MQGPFQGLKIVAGPQWIDWPALLGTWERELHPVIERLIADPPRTVINIGAATGYYAVGLAVRCPQTSVLAYEIRPEMQRHVTTLAASNGVANRVRALGRCDHAELATALADHPESLILMDIEGGEVDLLDLERHPGLRRCRLLVEEHEVFVPGCLDILTARFAPTHRVEVIPGQARVPADLPLRWPLANRWLRRLMNEGRSQPQSWLNMTPVETSR